VKSSARDTPMMRQYSKIKAQYSDAIVLYRMGDFYELFLDDAELVAPLLDLALTTRDKDKTDPVPMCGFPVHSSDGYVKRLAALGHRVAICEQVEDPKAVGGRRLVRREVVEVVTPGLVGDPAGIEALCEVTVVALVLSGVERDVGLAALDASTGDFRATCVPVGDSADAAGQLLLEELQRIAPREILLSSETSVELRDQLTRRLPDVALTTVSPATFDPATAPTQPEGFDRDAVSADQRAAAALLRYLGENQPFALSNAPRLRSYRLRDTMVLDAATCRHLELFENSEDRSREGTLVAQLDLTVTALGARRLCRWIRYPLLDPVAIGARQDAIAYLAERDRPRARLREALRGVRDLERILARAARPTAVPRDLGILRASLSALPVVQRALLEETSSAGQDLLAVTGEAPGELRLPEPLPELTQLLDEALIDDPPVVARGSRGAGETGYIREEFRPELDALRESATKGREWIARLEATERERTGIHKLKIRYHPVHGYSLEVSKTQLDRVPERYQRKQTLANVERFSTQELGEVQEQVMGANERAAELERQVFESLRQAVVAESGRIRAAAHRVADLDGLASLAEVSRREGWVRPSLDETDGIRVKAGRHPVVEAVLRRQSGEDFVPNDTDLDSRDAQILLLTGPNMSGKSTYLRQVALIVLMAQMGSFVPAESAQIGVVDRIFTRVGASDRLARGESTFMVEMRETSEILRCASPRSLIILDEIGRGTSTFDGLSIAWAVAEYLHDTPGLAARTLFATHYHELTDLARTKPRVRNAHFEARQWKDEVVFLRRLAPGGANRSYGIQVAKLAGLPDSLVDRARRILRNLEQGEFDGEGFPRLATADSGAGERTGQLVLALTDSADGNRGEREVLEEIKSSDPDRVTPMEALSALQDWHKRLRENDTS